MRTTVFLGRLAAAAALASVAIAGAAETVERTVPASPRGSVDIVNAAGDVRVRGWDRNEVKVSGELGSGVDRLDLRSDARRTSINVLSGRGSRRSGASELTVYVPRDSSLSINTISANQVVEDLRGEQRLQAVSGDIATQQWSEDVEVRTISGTVVIEGAGGRAETVVNTVSGTVTLTNAPEEIAVETVTGGLKIEVAKLARARIRTTNGELRLTATLAADARLDAETINGRVRLTLREPVNAQFDIETFNGGISNCFGPKPMRSHEYAPGNELRFTQGKGDARVRIKTLNGRVDLCKE